MGVTEKLSTDGVQGSVKRYKYYSNVALTVRLRICITHGPRETHCGRGSLSCCCKLNGSHGHVVPMVASNNPPENLMPFLWKSFLSRCRRASPIATPDGKGFHIKQEKDVTKIGAIELKINGISWWIMRLKSGEIMNEIRDTFQFRMWHEIYCCKATHTSWSAIIFRWYLPYFTDC
jgi:hypothetical protein